MAKFVLFFSSLLIAGSALATEIPLNNADFEKPIVGARIPGWSRTQHAGVGAYVVTTDTKDAGHGKSSISMHRTTEQVYGLIMQRVESKDLGGKEIEMSAMMKTFEVGELGWVMVMTFKDHGNILDQVRAEPVVGDTAWKEVVLKKIAPASTNLIELGFLLMDEGTGWADHVRLRTIDKADKPVIAKDKPASADKANPDSSKGSRKSPNPPQAQSRRVTKNDLLKPTEPKKHNGGG